MQSINLLVLLVICCKKVTAIDWDSWFDRFKIMNLTFPSALLDSFDKVKTTNLVSAQHLTAVSTLNFYPPRARPLYAFFESCVISVVTLVAGPINVCVAEIQTNSHRSKSYSFVSADNDLKTTYYAQDNCAGAVVNVEKDSLPSKIQQCANSPVYIHTHIAPEHPTDTLSYRLYNDATCVNSKETGFMLTGFDVAVEQCLFPNLMLPQTFLFPSCSQDCYDFIIHKDNSYTVYSSIDGTCTGQKADFPNFTSNLPLSMFGIILPVPLDVCTYDGGGYYIKATYNSPQLEYPKTVSWSTIPTDIPITLETNHPYDNLVLNMQFIQFESTNHYKIIFDPRSIIEDTYDFFYIKKGNYSKNMPAISGADLVPPMSGAGTVWSSEIIMESKNGLTVCFQSDRSNAKWGIRLRVEPYYPK